MNIALLLEMAAQARPDRVALGDAEGVQTYRWLHDQALRAARWMGERGVERVVYSDEAAPALPIALFGAAVADVAFVPVNYRLADDRLRSLIAAQAPAVLIAAGGTQHRFAGLAGVEVISSDAFSSAVATAPPPDPEPELPPDGVAVLLHTSGTSGPPKVAVLRHRHLSGYVIGSVDFAGAAEDEATLVSVPPYHVAGISAILTATYSGRRIVQLPSFSPEAWVEAVQRHRVTHAMTVPTMLARILDVVESQGGSPGQGPLRSLRHLSYGGGRMPVPVIERALRLAPGVDFVNAYGLTETSSTIAVLGPDDHRAALASTDPRVRRRLGSVGCPLPTVDIAVRDEQGRAVEAGTVGEIWVQGEQVSGEYLGREGGEGWFATHDRGWIDEDGYLYVDGRLDDVIVRGGENMSPGEIEDVLLDHPGIVEAAVVGVPDEEWGEVIAAVVVPAAGTEVTPEVIRDHVASRLRSSRRPQIVEIRDTLPCNDTGKVLRRVLRQELTRSQAPA